MSLQQQSLSRQDLLIALEKGWKQFLPQMAALSAEEQELYTQQQGFARIEDVLVHTFAWWEYAMPRARDLLRGLQAPGPKDSSDINRFNDEAIAHYQHWTRSAVEEQFTTTFTAFERFIQDLPEAAFEHPQVSFLLRIMVIEHYKAHRPPNGPEL